MADASGTGRFITLEGMDGAGKSTHLAAIAEALRARGHEVLMTREPGGTPLAEKLRGLVLAEPMDAVSETLLMFAARADHVERLIRPALARGTWVLCDRFTDSTLAYQGGGKGVSADLIHALARQAHPGLIPDRTLLFDCSYEVSRARLQEAGRAPDRFENESRVFFDRVRAAYRALSDAAPGRVRLIDGTQSPQAVSMQVGAALEGV